MTYDEYRNKKENKNSFFKDLLSKFFTVLIFSMIIIIMSNTNPNFRKFLTDKVLNNTWNFKVINKLTDDITSSLNKDNSIPAMKEEKSSEKYLDGIKYYVSENETIYLKDGGIVTYIGEKDGYNNTVIIEQSNGYYAWYGNIKENVKLYDYVESGTSIGESLSNEYYYVLLKDNKPIEINEEN